MWQNYSQKSLSNQNVDEENIFWVFEIQADRNKYKHKGPIKEKTSHSFKIKMNEFYETEIYLGMIRAPFKSVQHCCTGETQLQRISRNVSYRDLEYSLMHSKMLHKFLETHSLQEKFSEETFEQLCQIKGIFNQLNKFYLKKALKHFQCYKFSVKTIQETRKFKYDKNNQHHEKLLLQLWHNLMPKQQLKNRISDQWIDIGFQANDPSTDFRGAGFLGLWNLVEFSRNKKCRSVFQWAIYKDTAYFFCSAGLFLTMIALEISKQMTVPVQHWTFNNEKQILEKFQTVYNMLFMEFDHFWKSCENKSILQFNKNLLAFKSQMKTKSQQTIKERMIFWQEV